MEGTDESKIAYVKLSLKINNEDDTIVMEYE
jgi:hypothetical protein